MAVTGKVFTLFRPILRFSILSRSSRNFGILSIKSRHEYCKLQYPLLSSVCKYIKPTKNSCFASQVAAMSALSPMDPSSYSRPEIAVVMHTSFSLNVDFEKKVLSGSALITINVLEDTDEVILDSSSLTINSIELEDGTPLKYTLGDDLPNYGSKLTIKLPKTEISGETSIASPMVGCIPLSFHDTYYKIDKFDCTTQTSESSLETIESSPETVGSNKKTIESSRQTSDLNKRTSEPSRKSIESNKKTIELSRESIESNKKTRKPSRETSELNKKTREPSRETSEFNKKTSEPSRKNSSCCCTCEVCRRYGAEDPPAIKSRFKIKIDYASSQSASALQWLEPSQTSGKKHPYLFSQCQPIHARSIIPCQDTPAVKFTYDAEVTAPEEFTVLMSALRGESRGARTSFRQPVPIPAYLLAIAVGVLESRELGPRSRVWSEKEEIERSAWEFAETEKYLQAAERLSGPYVWTQYDLLVLPPSFPYGGMENPCLTFVTPTLLAGDRSLANVLVHEIMHSWTGNLVTNRNFEHFWLNEGFTVFTERKVDASLIADSAEAKKNRDFQSLLGLQELTETVNTLGANNPLTQLQVNLTGVHPDDAFSRIPYEKGSLFLRYLEDLVGGPEVFDDFLRSYLNHFQRKSLDTDQFKAYLLKYFSDSEKLKTVDWDAWLHTSGMPPVIPDYDTSMTKAITTLLGQIKQDHEFTYKDVKVFTPHQMIHLLQELIDRPALPVDRLRSMGLAYKIAISQNAEIKYRWMRLCIRSKDLDKLPEALEFVNTQGRMKYVRPIYRDLYAWEEVRQEAINNFLENEKYMMHVSAYTLRKDLHISE